MRSLLVLALTACSARTPAPAAPVDSLPAHFAGLFITGEQTFPAELVTTHQDEAGPISTKQPGEVTCTISNVQTIRGGRTADVACSGLELVDQISGTYLGTSEGLWKASGTTKLKLLGAVPEKARSERKGSDRDIESGSATIVEPHAGGWCVMVTSWGGDGGGWQLCLKEGAGIIGGHGFFAGGQSRDAYFGDVRRI